MAIPALTTQSTVLCPHGGQVSLSTANAMAQTQQGRLLLQTDTHTVSGCAFTVGTKPQPCVLVRWVTGAALSKVNGTPILLQSSVGMCFSAEQIPQGPAVVVAASATVTGT